MKAAFRVYCETVFGEVVVLAGNAQELGNWDPHNAIPLSYVKYGWWECTVELNSLQGIEYKYIKRTAAQEPIWEVGKNRDLDHLEESDKCSVTVVDVWNSRVPYLSADGASQFTLKVMTYNIRYDTSTDGTNSWNYRKDHVAKLVRTSASHIIGFQEPLYHQVKDLEAALRENYSWVGTGRDGTGNSGEFSPIFFDHHLFHCMDHGTFWISETPDRPGSSSWNSACLRICTWAKLVVKSANIAFFVFNTHLDHRSSLARKEGLQLLYCKINAMTNGHPSVLCGDFNADESDSLISSFTNPKGHVSYFSKFRKSKSNSRNSTDTEVFPTYMLNSKFVSMTAPKGPTHTFTGWNYSDLCTIDYILVKPNMRVFSHEVLEGKSDDGKPCSDHRPVCADILI